MGTTPAWATSEPAVFPLRKITPAHAQSILRSLFPGAKIALDPSAKAVIVVASPSDLDAIRGVISHIDVTGGGHATAARSRPRPAAAAAPDQVTETYHVDQALPDSVARAVAAGARSVRVSRSGDALLLSGTAGDVARAKQLAASLDEPPPSVKYTQLYHIHNYDATSVADFLGKSYTRVTIRVDKDLNALTVLGNAADQHEVGAAIAQLDVADSHGPGGIKIAQAGAVGAPIGANGTVQVYTLRAALPGVGGAGSTSASDIAATVTQALSSNAPDLRITVMPSTNQLIMTGSPYSLQLARDLIDQLDVAQKLVVMDTQIYEVDTTAAHDLGLSFTEPAVLTTSFSEVLPPTNPTTGAPGILNAIGPITRTPLSLAIQLNLLVTNGLAKVLANPRITTVSGRTASIRAGDTISVQTTAGGGAGTVATTQLQTFQTGVTLDITPVINADNFISVLLHPTVNSETGLLNGIPQISTRDTQTTVALHDGETLVIGGLIQRSSTRTINKIPLLGSLPLIGGIFREDNYTSTDNDLIITVTPHIVTPGDDPFARRGLPTVPTQQRLRQVPIEYTPPPVGVPQPSFDGPVTPAPRVRPTPMQVEPTPTPTPRPVRTRATPPPAASLVQPPAQYNYTPAAAPTVGHIPGGPVNGTVPGGPLPAGASVPGGPVVGTPVPGGPIVTSQNRGGVATPPPAPQGPVSYGAGTSPAANNGAPTNGVGFSGNALVYGQVPTNNDAGPSDPVRIFYADLSPAVVRRGVNIFVNAVTTANVAQVTLTDSVIRLQLSQVSRGRWSARFGFPPSFGVTGIEQLTLTAYRSDGATASVQFPVTVSP